MTKIRDKELILAFGKKVKEIRIKKGVSQYQLSYDSDIPRSQVVRIENGEINTTISSAMALAKALNVSINKFFDT